MNKPLLSTTNLKNRQDSTFLTLQGSINYWVTRLWRYYVLGSIKRVFVFSFDKHVTFSVHTWNKCVNETLAKVQQRRSLPSRLAFISLRCDCYFFQLYASVTSTFPCCQKSPHSQFWHHQWYFCPSSSSQSVSTLDTVLSISLPFCLSHLLLHNPLPPHCQLHDIQGDSSEGFHQSPAGSTPPPPVSRLWR